MDDTSNTSSLLTVTNSILHSLYRFEGGRQFQSSNSDYPLPCDSTATRMERLIAESSEMVYLNGLYPEPAPGQLERVLSTQQPRVLDLGSGSTASWAIAMAERFPLVEVIGVDLIACEVDFLPLNLQTEIHDIVDGLPYVHCRYAQASFLEEPSLDFLTEVLRVLRPGGVFFCMTVEDRRAPFYSLTPNNPHLAPALARISLRYDALAALGIHRLGTPSTETPPGWGASMKAALQKVSTDSGSRFKRNETLIEWIELPFGTPSAGGGRQVGTVVREIWLEGLQLLMAAAGLDEEAVRKERELDEQALPEMHAGLYVRSGVVWAVKDV